MQVQGQLVVVGTGIMLGAHLTPRCQAFIADADVVFAAVTDALTEQWLRSLNPSLESFAPLYQQGKPRNQTYQQMVDQLLAQVRLGKKVVAAFYGHPGVFAQVAEMAIRAAREEGYVAQMEPGISAADCLHADLQIDPAKVGCCYMEASQLLFYRRTIDVTAYLVLWQVALAGDITLSQLQSQSALIQVLVEHLQQWYPADHPVVVYEAASLPFLNVRRDTMALSELVHATLNLKSTLVIPPAQPLQPNQAMMARLKQLQSQ